jgi:excinuclease ABC subunit A
MREELSKYQTSQPCETCHGARLKPEALSVKIAGEDISIPRHPQGNPRAAGLPQQCRPRLPQPRSAPPAPCPAARASASASPRQIGSGLTGVLYVLDEPSIGLHQRDNDRLLATLKRLRDLGNTVIVVEHDEDAIRAADYVVDMGPGAGVHGGEVVAQGTPDEVMANPDSASPRNI